MPRYNPDKAPKAAKWLALGELKRIILVEDYHRRAGVQLPNVRVHATIHAMVESQLAEAVPAVGDALSRLTAEGLRRHDALHAIGLVLAEHMGALMRDEFRGPNPNVAYEQALHELTAESWRAV